MISTEMPRRRSRSSQSWICAQASESFSRTPTVRLERLSRMSSSTPSSQRSTSACTAGSPRLHAHGDLGLANAARAMEHHQALLRDDRIEHHAARRQVEGDEDATHARDSVKENIFSPCEYFY